MAENPKVLLLIESSREFGRALLTGVADYARFHGPWSIYTSPPFFKHPGGNKRLLARMKRIGVDGIIAREMDEMAAIKAMGIPAVFASTIAPQKGMPEHAFPIITTDNAAIVRMAADHLLDRGFRRFAYCGYDDIPWSQLRGQCFMDCIASAGHETYPYTQPKSRAGRLWENELPVLARWLQELPKPLGLMTCSDDRSQNVVEAAKVAGVRIPEEVAVIGVDNDMLVCHLTSPPLSSVALATESGGVEAAQLLAEFMAERRAMAGQRIVIAPTHVETRHSTDILAMDDPEVVKAMQYIRDHRNEPMQVAEVTDATSLSRRTLERRFLKVLDRTVQDEINRMRVEQIARMLLQTHMSPVQIAQTMGYSSPDNMRRFFQRYKKKTPLQFRRESGHR